MTDLIVTWPTNCDYPLFREFLHTDRDRFANVIVVFHETHQLPSFREFVMEVLENDRVTFVYIPSPPPNRDWRDNAIHTALQHSDADHVCFMEQDFFPRGEFWTYVRQYREYDAIGIVDGERIHPCFLLMSKTALANTCMDFGTVEGKLDHFGLIQKDLQNEANKITFTAIPNYPKEADKLYYHMNGLSHNMRLLWEAIPITYKETEFIDYLKRSLKAQVRLSIFYKMAAEKYLQTAKKA